VLSRALHLFLPVKNLLTSTHEALFVKQVADLVSQINREPPPSVAENPYIFNAVSSALSVNDIALIIAVFHASGVAVIRKAHQRFNVSGPVAEFDLVGCAEGQEMIKLVLYACIWVRPYRSVII
tara:strand:- start:93 stop:464 length:372 start_codon:yes stop_codon:yes gene_type:complete